MNERWECNAMVTYMVTTVDAITSSFLPFAQMSLPVLKWNNLHVYRHLVMLSARRQSTQECHMTRHLSGFSWCLHVPCG